MTDKALRFGFGQNWQDFSPLLDERRIQSAMRDLQEKLRCDSLAGKRFLDAGCGSGLSSLAARRLGANVVSFDYDPKSVACTQALKARFLPDDDEWEIGEGSVLDAEYLQSLGTFDIVYSWGVLHHTGDMWQALERVLGCLKPEGQLFIAIYNALPNKSRLWWHIKKRYVSAPGWLQQAMVAGYLSFSEAKYVTLSLLRGENPLPRYQAHGSGDRGMSLWYDAVDWVGGFPYEYAEVHRIFDFYRTRGLQLDYLYACGGTGCNIFVFSR